jgi:hypothetical protein
MSSSDKEGLRSDSGHHYGATYHSLFRKLKYRRVTLLEIGVGGGDRGAGGDSLVVWRCFFPFGKIIGCDVEDKTRISGGNIHVHIVDQSSEADLSRITHDEGPFDIIIDDGSHRNDHQIFTFSKLFDSLKERGIYVIEDVQTSYWPEFSGKPIRCQDTTTCMGYFLQLANYLNYTEMRTSEGVVTDMLNIGKRIRSIYFEHNLIVVHKDSRPRYSNKDMF